MITFNAWRPEVLSIDVDADNRIIESEYYLRIGDHIKYILVNPGTFHEDILSFPPDLFIHLPKVTGHVRAQYSENLVIWSSNSLHFLVWL